MSDDDKARRVFDVLVREHAAMLVTYLCGMTRSRAEAEDIAQEAFVKAFRRFDQFGDRGTNFAAWLRRIARNTFINRYHRAGRRTVVVEPGVFEGMEDVFAAADEYGQGDTWTERLAALRECLSDLPERLHAVCRLHYYEGRKAKDVAAGLGVKLNAVLKRLERARGALRACIERKLGVSEAQEMEGAL